MTTAKVLALAVGYGIFSFSILGFGDLHGHGCELLCFLLLPWSASRSAGFAPCLFTLSSPQGQKGLDARTVSLCFTCSAALSDPTSANLISTGGHVHTLCTGWTCHTLEVGTLGYVVKPPIGSFRSSLSVSPCPRWGRRRCVLFSYGTATRIRLAGAPVNAYSVLI